MPSIPALTSMWGKRLFQILKCTRGDGGEMPKTYRPEETIILALGCAAATP